MAKVEEYYVHKIDDKTCRMQKAVNGDIIATSSYVVGDSSCQCYQALRPARCRHMDIRQRWKLRKIDPQSAIYNMKTDQFDIIPAAE